MNKSIYQEYAALEARKDDIEGRQKELKFQMLDEMRAELVEGQTGVELDVGSFTLQEKITYKFSKDTQALEKVLKQKKLEEVAKGTAKKDSVTQYVVFRPTKTVVVAD